MDPHGSLLSHDDGCCQIDFFDKNEKRELLVKILDILLQAIITWPIKTLYFPYFGKYWVTAQVEEGRK